jgi:hypothetical protein
MYQSASHYLEEPSKCSSAALYALFGSSGRGGSYILQLGHRYVSCYQGPGMLYFRICLSCSWVKRPCLSPFAKDCGAPELCRHEPPRDKTDLQTTAGMTQAARGKTAIADQHDLAFGKPSPHEPDQDLCRLDRRAMSFAEFGAGRRREAWEC